MAAETDVRNLGRELRAVVEVADALERIGSLQQAKRDAEEAVDEAKKAALEVGALHRDVEQELAEARVRVDAASQKARLTLSNAGIEAREIVSAAKTAAEKLATETADAVADARDVMEAEREEHALFMEAADLTEVEAREALDAINTELEAARERIGL